MSQPAYCAAFGCDFFRTADSGAVVTNLAAGLGSVFALPAGIYLNHGFHYFAPEPGSSNLVSWSVTREDGSVVSGQFPNFQIHPRLLYHRHFMLSEVLGNSDPELQSEIVKGFARNLLREHNGRSVSLSTVRHELSTMIRVRAGGKLTDPDLYSEQPLGSYTKDELQ